MSRLRENLSQIPLSTFCFGGICIATFLFQVIANPETHEYTMNPKRVIFKHEYYRMVTCAFFHGGVMHIGMNMLSFMALGKSLEKYFGTMWMFVTIVWSILLTPSIEMIIAYTTKMMGNDDLVKQHSLGFSAVLFHLLTIECAVHGNSSRSIFGMVTVSSKFYPWAMLLVTQFLLPNISFVGHLSGILAGTLQCGGHLNSIIPSDVILRRCDDFPRLRCVTSRDAYIRAASSDAFAVFSNGSSRVGTGTSTSTSAGSGGGICSVVTIISYFVGGALQTIKHLIFGFWGQRDSESTEEMVELNEGDWVGIPDVSSNEIPQESEIV